MNVSRSKHSHRVAWAALAGLLFVTGCEAGGATLVAPTPVDQGVSVNPTSITVVAGGPARAVAATVGASPNSSPTVIWSSSDLSVASVTPSGDSAMVTGLKPGTATITATSTSDNTQRGTATVQVTPGALARILVSGSSTQVAPAGTLPLHAAAIDAAGDTLTGAAFAWNTSNPSVATVDGSGVVTGVAPGTANVTATSGSVSSGAFAVTVVNSAVGVAATVAISAPASSIAVAAITQAVAVVRDAGHTLSGASVTWASSNAAVATVSSAGLITGVSAGTANITATSGQAASNVLAVTVTATAPVLATITVSAPASSVAVNGTLALQATALDTKGNTLSGIAFTWASSAPSVAAVSSTGVVTGVAAGRANITATSGSVTSSAVQITVASSSVAVASVSVSASSSTVTTFQTLQAQAVAKDASGNVVSGQSFSWSSSNASVATVDGSGLVTAVAPGSVSITATTGGVTSNSLSLTIVNPPVASITVTAPSSSMGLLSTMQAQAVAKDASGHVLQGIAFSWASSNATAATVSSTGLVSALLVGTTEITASSGTVTSNAFTVTVAALP